MKLLKKNLRAIGIYSYSQTTLGANKFDKKKLIN